MGRNLVFFATIFLCLDLNLARLDGSLTNLQDVIRSTSLKYQDQVTRGQVNRFQYINCGHPETDVFNLTSLVISPNPIQLPGTATISAGFKFRVTARSPIKLQVDFYRYVLGSWLKIPCVAEIGSCTYDDICEFLDLIPVCPHQLVEAGIPCKCPFEQGTYTLPESKFVVPFPILPSGDYKIHSVYTNGESPGACLELYFSIA
ncbi:hypothetical protein RRG08_024572 [Elysia crispata]|uniref:MD-2-related lipid-recognition domain-containing protein n=1 Tax=Elysia crispata TaxID=231223 RepID=A0AAE0ZWD9_9GAST|nr:hypothetical protein RRG08_024572 [Elysia crispata]